MVDVCYPEGTDWSCAYTPEELAELDPVVVERAEALAWSTLAALTGFRLSLCPITIRPCASRCNMQTWYVAPVGSGNFAGAPPGSAFSPYVSNGAWFNACGCVSSWDCSCSTLCEVILPSTVGGITEVWLDGAVLDPTAYRVDNGNRLVRVDGECFPACQDMSINDRADGGLWVTYYPGVGPNDLFRYAAGVLANEFYKACSGKDCRLPSGVTNITRAGITMEVAPGTFPGGMTGIAEVDAVIRIYNPYALKSPPRVLSPDRRFGRVQTWG